ncbi:Pol protein, partial [Phytophthora palmivora]
MEVHLKHLRRVFEVMRANKLYANIDKCVFAAEEIKALGCFVSRVCVHIDPGKVKAIAAWPTPRSQKDLRKWLGLANYLHKYSAGYAELARPLSDFLKKDADWVWEQPHQDAFDSIKYPPVLALADKNYTPVVRLLSEGKDAKVDRISPRQRAQLHCYVLVDGLLHYLVDPDDPPRVVVPNDEDLKYDILLKTHDAPMSGLLGREKTSQAVSQTFWWPHMYKWMANYVKTCETFQRERPSGRVSAPLQRLPVPADCWKSRSLDSVFGLLADDKGNTRGVWDTLFQLLGTESAMSAADHPRTDGQTERVNRVLIDTLRSICAEAPRSWSDQLPMVEFALNNAVHASTGFTPFYLNGLRHPQVPLTLRGGTGASIVSGGEAMKAFSSQVSDIEPAGLETLWRRPRIDKGVLRQEWARKLIRAYGWGLGPFRHNKLKHRFIRPVRVLGSHGAAYTIDLVKSMATHPTSYVGRLKRIFPLRGLKKIKSGKAPLFKPRLSLAANTNRSRQSLQKGMQAGTHAAHKKSTLGPHGHLTMRLIGKSIKAPTGFL